MADAQKTYDATPPETRDKMKAEPSRLPVDAPEVKAKLRELVPEYGAEAEEAAEPPLPRRLHVK
jgi:hypothetical protein